MDEQRPHESFNREEWDRRSDDYQSRHGPQIAAAGGAAWGVWQLPESEIGALGEVRDLDVLEFGCGAAQWSIALQARGARTTGLDISERQLEHARALMAEAGSLSRSSNRAPSRHRSQTSRSTSCSATTAR